jgi:alkylation response protein AidB-like acyl-CoA dehydrogenase
MGMNMDPSFSPVELEFREVVREFLRRRLPPRLSAKVRDGRRLTKQDMELWHRILSQQGWLATHWPKEHGGTGWSLVQRFIFDNESALAFAPRIVPYGLKMLGPVLIEFGSEAQRRHWLPRMLDGSDWWAQGFSEPSAGSDLAGLRTSAVRDADSYVINGQKTWTSLGQHANMMFCLVRTDAAAKKQQGISLVLVDLRSAGVEVRPIRLLDGEPEVNEVFFSEVRVPAENLVGEQNRGWAYAKYLLNFERTNLAGVGFSVAALERVRSFAQQKRWNGRALLDDPHFAARLARVEIDLLNMQTTNLRILDAAARAGAPGPESSMLKIKGSQLRQEIAALTRRAAGIDAQPYFPEAIELPETVTVGPIETLSAATSYFNNRKLSIFGGSNEIQKNIVSTAVLRL